MGSYLFYPTVVCSMAGWLKGVWIPFLFSLVLNSRRSSKTWIVPLLLGWCFASISMIPAVAMASGSMESEAHVFSCLS